MNRSTYIIWILFYISLVYGQSLLTLPKDDFVPSDNVLRFWLNGRQTSYLTDYPFASPGQQEARVDAWIVNNGVLEWPGGVTAFLMKQEFGWTSNGLFGNDTSPTPPGGVKYFVGSVNVPEIVGVFELNFGLIEEDGDVLNDKITVYVESTCSDGLFCNGKELWLDGSCVAVGNDPCVVPDPNNCTVVGCSEETKLCSYAILPGCEICTGCVPTCETEDGFVKECGLDNCFGSCGLCSGGLSCVDGTCTNATTPGTCSNPLRFFPQDSIMVGRLTLRGDTSQGLFSVPAECNSRSTAKQLIYLLTIPPGPSYGIMAQYFGYDTVLDIRIGTCDGPSLTCSDDAYPPGNTGSRVETLLSPGDYYFLLGGYSEENVGPFTFFMDIVQQCVPRCASSNCGDNGCGGDCGPCAPGFICNPGRKCIANDCVVNCTANECGDDGCGGLCGSCTAPDLCTHSTGQCDIFQACNSDVPQCDPPCGSDEFCATDCVCYNKDLDLPDLFVEQEILESQLKLQTLNFSAIDCAVVEGCILQPGVRRVLRFSVQTINQGKGLLKLGDPSERPDIFVYSPCHQHYHFNGYSNYLLLNKTEPYNQVILGHKQGYCVYDGHRHLQGPGFACTSAHSCSNQGIQPGWVDNYSWDLDCQWLDITDLAPGEYILFIEINYLRMIVESEYGNNIAYVPVTIPPPNPNEEIPSRAISLPPGFRSTDTKKKRSGATKKKRSVGLSADKDKKKKEPLNVNIQIKTNSNVQVKSVKVR